MSEFHLKDEVTILDPHTLKLDRDPFGDLILKVQDRTYERVKASRAFPLSFPEHYIVLRNQEGEIGLLEDIRQLDRHSRKILEQELRKAYFIPKITRIYSLEEKYGVSKWYVETDRGPRRFDIRSRDDIKPVPPFRVLFRDADGNRYEIPDVRQLDSKSRDLLDSET